MALKHYRELVAWQKAMDLVVAVYQATGLLPVDELYGLRSQLRRAAVSIPSNIAEGQGRGTPDEFKRFLRIANGSRQEVETQIVVAERLGYLEPALVRRLIEMSEEVGRLNSGLLRSL
jgi:four helix bundle protein